MFADIAGQEHIKRTLQQELATGRTAHAYLFSGPRAVGKTTTARVFTRAVNCTTRKEMESEPCNTCEACVSILANRTLDVLEIDAASHTGVENVRENIIAAARVGRAGLLNKVFIIDEAHMLSTPAFNALLKFLEEPPSNVLFILATTELHKVPATIISRCQRFEFKKIPPDAMRTRLEHLISQEKKKVDAEVITTIIRLSDGCQRDAESLLGQVLSLDDKKIDAEKASMVLPMSSHVLVAEFMKAIFEKEAQKTLALIPRVIDRGIDLGVFIRDVLEYLRTILLIKAGASSLIEESESEIGERAEMSKNMPEQELLTVIAYFQTAEHDTRYFAVPQLPIEIAIIKSCM